MLSDVSGAKRHICIRKRAKLLTSALRSFLRFARYRGAVTLDLAAVVPAVANWSMPSIPRAIGAGDSIRCQRATRIYAVYLG